MWWHQAFFLLAALAVELGAEMVRPAAELFSAACTCRLWHCRPMQPTCTAHGACARRWFPTGPLRRWVEQGTFPRKPLTTARQRCRLI